MLKISIPFNIQERRKTDYLLRQIFLSGSDETVACVAAGLAKRNCKK